jgi:hypothetical protein
MVCLYQDYVHNNKHCLAQNLTVQYYILRMIHNVCLTVFKSVYNIYIHFITVNPLKTEFILNNI